MLVVASYIYKIQKSLFFNGDFFLLKNETMKNLITSITNQQNKRNYFIDKKQVHLFVDELFALLFEGRQSNNDISSKITELKNDFTSILNEILKDKIESNKKSTLFFDSLFQQYKLLLKDALFILNNDPASKTIDEIYISYPGFFAIAVYRLAHQLLHLNIPLIPRVFTEYAHSKTGIDIHPGAVIGESFFIDHGTGIVIGETTKIGENVKLYQGVTLGALSVSKDKASTKRHPTIEDNVVIYSGATILGGETIIGKNSIIGGNVWLTDSVQKKSKIFHKSQIIIKK